MNKHIRVTSFQTCILVYFIVRSTSLGMVMNNYIKFGKNNAYLSPIIGTILGFIPLLMFLKLADYRPDLNINDKNICLFGKKIGNIINIIIMTSISFLAVLIIWNLTNFICSQYLYKTSKFIVSIIFMVPIVYISLKNIKVLLRSSNLLFYFSCFIFITCIIGLVVQVKFNNLLPFLEDGIMGPFNGALSHIAFAVLPLFSLLIIPKDIIKDKKIFNKYIIIMYLIASLSKIIVIFFTVSVFGIDLAYIYKFPDYLLLRRIMSGGFFERLESILAIQWFFDFFIALSFYFYYIKISAKQIFNIKHQNIFIVIVIALLTYLNFIIFNTTTEGNNFMIYKLPFILFILFFIIPFIIFIKTKYKKT